MYIRVGQVPRLGHRCFNPHPTSKPGATGFLICADVALIDVSILTRRENRVPRDGDFVCGVVEQIENICAVASRRNGEHFYRQPLHRGSVGGIIVVVRSVVLRGGSGVWLASRAG